MINDYFNWFAQAEDGLNNYVACMIVLWLVGGFVAALFAGAVGEEKGARAGWRVFFLIVIALHLIPFLLLPAAAVTILGLIVWAFLPIDTIKGRKRKKEMRKPYEEEHAHMLAEIERLEREVGIRGTSN